MKKTKEELSKIRAEVGRKGGLRTKERHGSKHYKRISPIGLTNRWHKTA